MGHENRIIIFLKLRETKKGAIERTFQIKLASQNSDMKNSACTVGKPTRTGRVLKSEFLSISDLIISQFALLDEIRSDMRGPK